MRRTLPSHPLNLQTLGVDDFAGKRSTAVSAHVKVDAKTGEMMFFEYSVRPPYMHYGVVSAAGEQLSLIPVELPGPRLPHDMAITENYSILMDLPVCVDTRPCSAGAGAVSTARSWVRALPSFHATARWESCPVQRLAVLHLPCDQCLGRSPGQAGHGGAQGGQSGGQQRAKFGLGIRAHVAEVEMNAGIGNGASNLQTGETSERCLDKVNAEFPSTNPREQGYQPRYGYAVPSAPSTLR